MGDNGPMTRRALLWSGFGALAGSVLLGFVLMGLLDGIAGGVDQWWNDLMNQSRPPWLVEFSLVMNRVGGGWIAILAVPVLIAVALVIARRWRAAVFAVSTFVFSALLVQLLKSLFGRARPEEMLVLSDYGSFPSGHTANAATIALVLWLLFPRVWVGILGILWALAMALSRTALSVHWLTDTIAGLLVGAAAAFLVGALLLPWVRTRVDEREPLARVE